MGWSVVIFGSIPKFFSHSLYSGERQLPFGPLVIPAQRVIVTLRKITYHIWQRVAVGIYNIVTLLWFRPPFRPCVDIVNTIETTPLLVSLSDLTDMLTMMRGWTLLRPKVKVTMDIYGNKLVDTIATKPLCASWSNLVDICLLSLIKKRAC